MNAAVLAAASTLLLSAGAHAISSQPAAGQAGMVASAHHLATEVGVEILRRGGNAVDAAVAVGYALAVTIPRAGNLGGGGFMIVRMADGRETMIDFREAAPLAASRDMYLDKTGALADEGGARTWTGVAVPGTVAGLELARQKYGSMPIRPLVEPAVKLARDGFVLTQWDDPIEHAGMLKGFARTDPYVGKYFLDHGEAYRIGKRFRQPALARTLATIAKDGPRAFYHGWIADETVRASKASGGILTKEDFTRYRALEYKPVHCDYRGYAVISAAPPSSGGVSLCETLNVLEGLPLSRNGFQSTQNLHYLIETFRYAYADRNLEIGDPRFVANDVDRLISKDYGNQIRAKIQSDRAELSANVNGGTPQRERTHTTHYTVLDRAGNAVSLTYSLGLNFGSGKVAGETGIVLNDTMIGFTAKVGAPNVFGLVQGEANAIAPEKRSLSSMSPTVILKDGKVFMVVGARGGARIISGTVQTVLNVIDYGMSVTDAVNADRIHHQWLPDTVYVEGRAIPPDARANLEKMGHKFTQDRANVVSNAVTAIVVDPRTGLMTGAHDNREPAGSALGL